MKINGYVELKTEYIWNKAANGLVRIDEARAKKKEKIIQAKREEMLRKSFLDRMLQREKKIPSDEEVWMRLRYEAENTFLGTYPDYWVSNFMSDYEDALKEIMSASQSADSMLVTSSLAALLAKEEG